MKEEIDSDFEEDEFVVRRKRKRTRIKREYTSDGDEDDDDYEGGSSEGGKKYRYDAWGHKSQKSKPIELVHHFSV